MVTVTVMVEFKIQSQWERRMGLCGIRMKRQGTAGPLSPNASSGPNPLKRYKHDCGSGLGLRRAMVTVTVMVKFKVQSQGKVEV